MNAHINSSLNGLDVSFCPSLVTGNNRDLIDSLLLPVFPLASNLTQREWSSSWVLSCTKSGSLSHSPFHVPFPFTATQVNSKRAEEGGLIAVLEQVQARLQSCWGGWSTWRKRRRLRGDLFALLNTSGVCREDGARLFLEVEEHRDRTKGNRHNCNREIFQLDRKKFFFRRLLPNWMNGWYLGWLLTHWGH